MKQLFLLLLCFAGIAEKAFAQGCSLCSRTVEGLGHESAAGLNSGIIYLAAIPLVFIGTVGYIWYRKNKGSI
jgi:hypothetical protein